MHFSVESINNPIQLILSQEGAILDFSSSNDTAFDLLLKSYKGKPLNELLLSMNPSWAAFLPSDGYFKRQNLFLSFSGDATLSTGLRVDVLPHMSRVFVCLTPSLPPSNKLQALSLDNITKDPSLIAQMHLRLKVAESRLNHYMDHFPGVFFSQRADLSFNYINPSFSKLIDGQLDKLKKSTSAFEQLIYEDDRKKVLQEIKDASTSEKTVSFSYRIQNPDTKSVIYLLDVRTPIFAPSGMLLGYDGVLLDNTRQAIAENRLSHSAWKENLAILTSGLVHDFSNMMAGIFSLTEHYLSSMSEKDPMYEGIEQVKKNALQAQKLVRRIIELNREETGRNNYFNVEHLIRDQLDLIRVILPKSTRLTTVFTDEEIPIYIDDVAFRQMLINLTMNAKDALHKNGEVSIRVKHIQRGDALFESSDDVSPMAEKEGVLIVFADNGEGISKENIGKIFQPFFSTKESSKGGGFGLYNIMHFIEKSYGKIHVHSVQGEGTSFYIYLPIATFDETKALSQESPSSRRRCLIYSSKDPSAFDIVSRLLEKEWEIITFSEVPAVSQYLKDGGLSPDALLAIDLGHDKNVEPLIDYFRAHHPDVKRMIQVVGRNPDEINSVFRNKVDLFLDDSIISTEAISLLSKALN